MARGADRPAGAQHERRGIPMTRTERRRRMAEEVRKIEAQIDGLRAALRHVPRARRWEFGPHLTRLQDRAGFLRRQVYGCESGESRFADTFGL